MTWLQKEQTKPPRPGTHLLSNPFVIRYWYGDGPLLSIPWKYLLIWTCTKARWEIWKYCNFTHNDRDYIKNIGENTAYQIILSECKEQLNYPFPFLSQNFLPHSLRRWKPPLQLAFSSNSNTVHLPSNSPFIDISYDLLSK